MTKYLLVLVGASALIVALHLVGLAEKESRDVVNRLWAAQTGLEATQVGQAGLIHDLRAALHVAENRITALELRVAKLEVKPKPDRGHPVPVFQRCGRFGC